MEITGNYDHHNGTKKEEEVKFESSHQSTPLICLHCEFLTFFQVELLAHSCANKIEPKIKCPGCMNMFGKNESLKSHLLNDHQVRSCEIELFMTSLRAEKPQQKIHIVDYQLLKKPNVIEGNQPKSKIFIKDVTLLRKPDLPNTNIAIPPNIFDSLDLTAEDDILDDFFNDDFDFDDSVNFNSIPTPEPAVPDVEIITHTVENPDSLSGKIFVRKNLCNDEVIPESEVEAIAESVELPTSKIYVRSHESLTSQVITTDVTQQPSEASTPDCIIVSSEVISEAPTSKIFIRNIETLTNPQQETSTNQYFPTNETANTPESYLNLSSNYSPAIYVPSNGGSFVRSYSDARPEQPETPESVQVPLQRCKISIKNMNSLIEPIHIQPPLINPTSMIFGQAQNLVIHMRPDESLIGYRDTSMTPDTLPGSCSDDVIILDDSETLLKAFSDNSNVQNEIVQLTENSHDVEVQVEPLTELQADNPERNQTPNEKTVLQKLELAGELIGQPREDCSELCQTPMVSIPIDFSETVNETVRKKKKIVKIIRIKKRIQNLPMKQSSDSQMSNIQIVFKCSIQDCNLHFSTEQLLNYHRKCHSSTTDSVIVCPECQSEEFRTFTTLHTHLWRLHKVNLDLYSCNLCDFKTPILARLKNFHEKIHSNERNFKCDFSKCEKSFKNAKQLRNHAQTHKIVKKKVKTVANVFSSDDSKKIRCEVCNKGFSSESGFYIHANEHNKTDIRKFQCESCEYSTNDHNSFRRHKSQHSMVHQYKCTACDYTSIQSNTYRKHLEKQHPEIAKSLLFKCGFCTFTTISKTKYDGHMMKHCMDEDEIAAKPTKKLGGNFSMKDSLVKDLKQNL